MKYTMETLKRDLSYGAIAFIIPIITFMAVQMVMWEFEPEPTPIVYEEITDKEIETYLRNKYDDQTIVVKDGLVVESKPIKQKSNTFVPEVWGNTPAMKDTSSKEIRKAMSKKITKGVCSDEQCKCLAYNIYHEARGENITGQKAVAKVTLNRVKDKRFASNVCDVVRDPHQFSWTKLSEKRKWRIEDRKSWNTAVQVAYMMLEKQIDYNLKAVHYHTGTVSPTWSKKMLKEKTIGNHIFFVEKS